MIGLLGKKIGMTRIFNQKGQHVPVTVVELGPCHVVDVRTLERDKYRAVQLGFGDIREKLVTKPRAGHFKKAGIAPARWVREIRDMDPESVKIGEALSCDIFKEGDRVKVTASTKGRGFQGVMKRHGFHGAKASHGAHEVHRHGGAIGAHTDPGRVWKNTKMPGRMGGDQQTVKNLEVVRVDTEANLVMIKGCVPCPAGSFIIVRKG